jgi:hypothetical protein
MLGDGVVEVKRLVSNRIARGHSDQFRGNKTKIIEQK